MNRWCWAGTNSTRPGFFVGKKMTSMNTCARYLEYGSHSCKCMLARAPTCDKLCEPSANEQLLLATLTVTPVSSLMNPLMPCTSGRGVAQVAGAWIMHARGRCRVSAGVDCTVINWASQSMFRSHIQLRQSFTATTHLRRRQCLAGIRRRSGWDGCLDDLQRAGTETRAIAVRTQRHEVRLAHVHCHRRRG